MWKFALQSKDGGREKFEIENTAAFMILKYKVFELTNIPPDKQILKTGRPPKEIKVDNEDVQIKDVGSQLQNMDLIIADEIPQLENNSPPSKKIKTSPLVFANSSLIENQVISNSLALNQNASSNTTNSTPTHYTFDHKIEPQTTSFYDGKVSRKIIPSDNSCLFAAVIHCLKPVLFKLNKKLNPMDLRYICSDYVKMESQQNVNSDLMHSIIAESDGKLNSSQEYSKRILNSNSWGGYIECKILSEYFQVQIVAGNIEIGTCNKYPDDNKKYGARIYILYDGIHYDACERGNGKSIFRCHDTDEIYNEVTSLLLSLKEKKQYTNTSTCSLICNECYTNLKGEKEAVAHAKQTGHQNFAQK